MNLRKLFPILAIAWVALFVGCKKDDFVEVDGKCPVVLVTSPANGEINVALNKVITATFNEPMNPLTITQASFTIQGGTAVAGTISYAGETASFTPSSPLLNNTTYVGKITTAVKDPAGNALQTNYIWSFSTGALVAPMVIFTDPADGATGVVLNKVVTATFSMPMDVATLTAANFTVRMGGNIVAGTVTNTDTTIAFTSTANLVADSVYTATITVGAKNLAGVAIAQDTSWSFTTGTILAPTVISTVPLNNATAVPQNQIITATFSEPMNPATINGSTMQVRDGLTLVPGTVTYSGSTATFTPTTNLLAGTVYTATITTGAQNMAAIGLANNYVWTFTTVVIPAPMVISTVPANNAIGVLRGQIITATFSEPMNPATIGTISFTVKDGVIPVSGTVTYSGVTATFTPTTQLNPSTLYTGTISTVATSAAGVPLANNYVWTFTTIVIPPPTVISTDPINNETGVLVNKVITATFSEAMDPLTINGSSFTLKQGLVTVPGAVTYVGNTASYTPTSNLASGTVYTATITTAARSSANSIPIATNYVWTFTTLVIPPPVVISTIPTNLATNVPLIQVVSADFSVPMDPLTINTLTFTLRKGVTVVPGVVGYSGTTATFTPNTFLESNATYTATVTNGVRSAQNVNMVNDYVWTFNTVPPLGPPPVDLASADAYGILAGVGISNNAGFSEIHDMNVGISPGVRSSVTGFPPAVVINGAIYCSDDVSPPGIAALLIQAKQDLTNAYLAAEGASSPAPVTVSGDIGGTTLAPGIYKSTSTLMIQSGDLTLDAQGDINATWIFQVSSAFTTVGGAGGNVILSGGAQAKNVFWQTGSSATIGDFTIFKGNVLALTSITMNSDAVAQGRMLARNGAVVMTSTNIITKP